MLENGSALSVLDAEPRSTLVGVGAVINRIDQLRSSGITLVDIADQAHVSFESIAKVAHHGSHADLRDYTWITIARNLDIPTAEVAVDLVATRGLTPIVVALETRRLTDGLTMPRVDEILELKSGGYGHELERSGRWTIKMCGRIRKWLGCAPEDVLREQGWWIKAPPFGKQLAVQLVSVNMTPPQLAAAARETTVAKEARAKSASPRRRHAAEQAARRRAEKGGPDYQRKKPAGPHHVFSVRAINDAISGEQIPNDEFVRAWAEALAREIMTHEAAVDAKTVSKRVAEIAGPLLRLAREARAQRPKPDVVQLIKKHVPKTLEMEADPGKRDYVIKKALRVQGENYIDATRLEANEVRDKWERDERRKRARREHFAAATPGEKTAYGLSLVRATLKGILGYCRVCFTITYSYAYRRPLGRDHFARSEYHEPCLEKWLQSDDYACEVERQRLGDRPAGRIDHGYPAAKRLSASELAVYWQATVLYLRLKDKEARRARFRKDEPCTVGEIAKLTGLGSEQAVRKCVQRIFELLPDPARCTGDFAHTVAALAQLRARAFPASF